MTQLKTALVLGATGGIGGAVAMALLRHGWSVLALARDPARAAADWPGGVQPIWIAGDAMNRADVVNAAEGVMAIVHAVNPKGYLDWDRLVLPMIENTIAAARQVGARIVLPGTIYNFDPRRIAVVGPKTPQAPRTRKGAIRARMERLLREASSEAPALIVRAGDFFGPGARQSWFSQSLVKAGKPVRSMLNPAVGAGHSWAYLPDLAETIARLMDMGDRLGAFECVPFEGCFDASGRVMTDAVRRAVGRNVPVHGFPWWLMRLLAPFGGFPREVAEIEGFWRRPMRFDNSRLVDLLGAEPRTPLDTAMMRTLAALDCLDPSIAGRPHPQPDGVTV